MFLLCLLPFPGCVVLRFSAGKKCIPSISLKSLYGKVCFRILYVQPNMKLSSADPRAFERFVLLSYLENERVCVHVCMNVGSMCVFMCVFISIGEIYDEIMPVLLYAPSPRIDDSVNM